MKDIYLGCLIVLLIAYCLLFTDHCLLITEDQCLRKTAERIISKTTTPVNQQ